jgi:hypothetical protein
LAEVEVDILVEVKGNEILAEAEVEGSEILAEVEVGKA